MRRAAAAALVLLAAAAAAPAGAAVRDTPVPILVYHHVARANGSADRALYVPPRRFARQMRALDRAGYTAITLGRAWKHWEENEPLPARPVILAFDDGFADQYRHAARVLRARGWPGVLNLQTTRLDRPGGLTRRRVRRMLRDGWELGAHSVTHADLTSVAPERLEDEVVESRRLLKQAFPSEPVDFFCYPYGRENAAVRAAVEAAGFLGATTTRRDAASPSDGAYSLDRIVITGTFRPKRVLREVGATSARR